MQLYFSSRFPFPFPFPFPFLSPLPSPFVSLVVAEHLMGPL